MVPKPQLARKEPALPLSIVSLSDAAKVRLELEQLADFLTQARLRKPGSKVALPRMSNRLDDLARLADVTLTSTTQCLNLKREFDQIIKTAPQVRLSFASEPNDAFRAEMAKWFRANIHPAVIINFGLLPSIAAGVVVRTTSHYFDLSFRKHLVENKHLLIESLKQAEPVNEQ